MEINVSCRYKEGIYSRHECGTVHCVAGWYLLAKRWNGKDRFLKGQNNYNFEDGARLMAWDAGFNTIKKMLNWADDNPKIWGNVYGENMFTGQSAYDCHPLYEIDLCKIANHFDGVADRLAEANTLKVYE